VPPRCSSSPPRHAIAWVCVFGRGSGAGAAGRELAARRRRTCSGGGRLSSLLFSSRAFSSLSRDGETATRSAPAVAFLVPASLAPAVGARRTTQRPTT
jgi:hypothetical protein